MESSPNTDRLSTLEPGNSQSIFPMRGLPIDLIPSLPVFWIPATVKSVIIEREHSADPNG